MSSRQTPTNKSAAYRGLPETRWSMETHWKVMRITANVSRAASSTLARKRTKASNNTKR